LIEAREPGGGDAGHRLLGEPKNDGC